MNTKVTILLFLVFIFSYLEQVNAHSGRTDSSGCHNCRTGACAGTYHCHGGGAVIPSQPTTVISPKANNENINTSNNPTSQQKDINNSEVEKTNTDNKNPGQDFVNLFSTLLFLGLGFYIFTVFKK